MFVPALLRQVLKREIPRNIFNNTQKLEGNVIVKMFRPDGGTAVDFISADYAQSQGKVLKKKEKEANFRVFNMK